MAKRNAATDLNHENWNEEDTPEEAGTFQKASTDEIKKRIIKTAKRRNPGLGNGSAKSAFAGFEGFKTASSTAPAASFSFGLGNASSSSNGAAKESVSLKSTQASTPFIISHNPITTAASTTSSTTTTDKTSTESSHSSEYYGQLKGLNECVSAWIKTHVDKNPICILTPIFRDYERYLAEIEESEKKKTDEPKKESSNEEKDESTPQSSTSSKDKTFSFTLGLQFPAASAAPSTTTTTTSTFFGSANSFQSSTKSDAPGSNLASGFVFGKKAEESKDRNIKNEVNPFLSGTSQNFNFGQSQGTLGGFSSTFPSAGFTFGGSSTFANTAKPESKQAEEKTAEKDEDDEETPKDEFKPIVEEDALYTKRCKLFVKKEGKFNECGVGTLHIKPVPASDDDDSKKKKIQVVVRADNAIGTVLLNVLLGGSSPLPAPTRVGRNNVMLVCPLPSESDNVPLPVLVRVKEGKDADELFTQLTELD